MRADGSDQAQMTPDTAAADEQISSRLVARWVDDCRDARARGRQSRGDRPGQRWFASRHRRGHDAELGGPVRRERPPARELSPEVLRPGHALPAARVRAGALLALMGLAGVHCSSDPSGPSPRAQGTPIPIEVGGTTVDVGSLGTGTIYVLHPVQNQTLNLFAQTSAVSYGPWVDVMDSAAHVTVAHIRLVADGAPLLAHRAYPPFTVQTGRTYQIYVGAAAGSKTKLLLYPVLVTPESGQDTLARGEVYGRIAGNHRRP